MLLKGCFAPRMVNASDGSIRPGYRFNFVSKQTKLTSVYGDHAIFRYYQRDVDRQLAIEKKA